MIADLVRVCGDRAMPADAMAVSDETLTLALVDGVLAGATSRESRGASLRVFAEGAVGWAGASDGAATVDELLEAALLAARAGAPLEVHLPRAAPMSRVFSADEEAATIPLHDLARLGADVSARLRGGQHQVLVTVERALGEVAVANTRGVEASYETTVAAIAVQLQAAAGDGVVTVRDSLAGVALPTDADVDLLVRDIERRLRWSASPASPPGAMAPVLLMPRALRHVLRPVEQALLSGDGGTVMPLAGALGEQRFAPAVHIDDAPLLPGRPGSRPIDDDGVVTQDQCLVDAGVVRRFLCDLVTGARIQRPSTGSARRTVLGPSRPGFSNLVLRAGPRSLEDLLRTMGDGLLVDELTGGAGAISAGGAFRFPVALGFLVRGGEVVGRVEGVAVSGNAFDMLARVLELGADARWVGSALLPPLLADGVEVGGR